MAGLTKQVLHERAAVPAHEALEGPSVAAQRIADTLLVRGPVVGQRCELGCRRRSSGLQPASLQEEYED
jgi:hypothetical protein